MSLYHKDETFTSITFNKTLPFQESENCTFNKCSFANLNLKDVLFSDCLFDQCDFSMATLKNTGFRDALFKGCKMIGLRFDECNKLSLSFSFERCILNFSTFHGLKLKKTTFNGCSLQEADFSAADLTESIFENCDLDRATFLRSVLEGTDFRTAYNIQIDPESNRLKGAKFTFSNVSGLLDKYGVIIE